MILMVDVLVLRRSERDFLVFCFAVGINPLDLTWTLIERAILKEAG